MQNPAFSAKSKTEHDFSGRYQVLAVALLLTLLALAIRLYGIGRWDIVYDEYFTYTYARERYLQIFGPIYYGLVALSYQFFGVSEFSVRLPALILGVAGVPVFFLTWRSLIGDRAALLGALLIVFSAWHLWYSQFGRWYSGLFLLGSLVYYYYYRSLREDSVRGLFLSFAIGAVALLFHFSALLVLAACSVYSTLLFFSPKLRGETCSLRVARLHVILSAIGVCIAVPLMLWELADWNERQQSWGYGPFGALLQFIKWIQMPVAACALVGALQLVVKRPGFGTFVGVCLGFPILAYLAGSALTTVRADYIFAAMPLAFVAAGYLCEEVRVAICRNRDAVRNHSAPRAQSWGMSLVSYAMPIVVVASLMPEFYSHFSGRATLHMREPAGFVESVFEPGDQVLPLINLFNSFHDYTVNDLPREPELGDPLDATVNWPQAMQPYRASGHCVWIVLPIRRQALAESLEHWLIANARLVWRTTSTRYDYKVEGYQVFVTGREPGRCVQRARRALVDPAAARAANRRARPGRR